MLTLVLSAGLSVLSLNMFLPSLANIADDLGADYSLVTLSVSGYLGITAILQLALGPMSDWYGRRPVLLGALAIFILASIGCMLAADIYVFLAFRVAQAVAIAGWVIPLAVIRDTSPEQQATSRIGYVSMAMAVGPMVGPLVGGLLDEGFGWRASFLLYTLLGAVTLAVCWRDLGETRGERSAGFGSQLAAYPGLLRAPHFWAFAACIAFSTSGFYVFLAGAPLLAESIDMPTGRLGLFIGATTAAFMVGSFLSGRYGKHLPVTRLVIIGRLVACCGLAAGLGFALSGQASLGTLLPAILCLGLGNGLTMPGANAGAMSARPDLAGSAAGLAGALTVGTGAVLTWFAGAVLTREHVASGLMGIMLFCAVAGLVAAACAAFLYRTVQRAREPVSRPHG
jgi:Bcr/CflA subfamily drug resistance transporter